MHRVPSACAAAVVAVALAAPTTAAADSVVFLDGGNVVSAEADGSKRVQLTTQGDWFSVAQADDGTIAAARNLTAIEIMAPDGRPLRSIATVPARTANGGTHRGTPINLAFSPDGTRIAYEYFDVTCPPASSCPSEQHSVLYTDVNPGGPSATPHATYGQLFGRRTPSFVTNGRVLAFGGSGAQVNLDDLGGGDGSDTLWFNGNTDLFDGELSRDGTRFALNVGTGADTRIGFFRVNGDPRTATPAAPTPEDVVCSSTPDAQNGGATWSPDGQALAYESSKGIEVVRFSAFAPGTCAVAGESVLTATGSEPDWGPADPPAARWTSTPPAPGGAPSPAQPRPEAPTPGPTTRPRPVSRLVLTPRRSGRRVTVRGRLETTGRCARARVRLVLTDRGGKRLATRTVVLTSSCAVRASLPVRGRRGPRALRLSARVVAGPRVPASPTYRLGVR